ncbi:MAG: hypothetical protein IK079_01050 [Desulfovibrio sp.]|nr:hypothetical protein [Desulfovibrio sp.]
MSTKQWMRVLQQGAFVLLALFLFGCEIGSPSAKKVLLEAAKALDVNDAQAFLTCFDLKACATNEIKNLTEKNAALSTLDQMGRTLGIGGMEDIIGNVFDMERNLRQNFMRKVSTGVLAKECSKSEISGCPWVSNALRQAEVKEDKRFKDCAVARVTTPTKLTTWLALAKFGKEWRIVGWAEMQDLAEKFAHQYVQSDGSEQKKNNTEMAI